MKTLFLKYMLLGLWLMCYIPFKRALVLSSQTPVVASTQIQESTISAFSPIKVLFRHKNQVITASQIKAAYSGHELTSEYSDSPMIYLDSWNQQSRGLLSGPPSSSWVHQRYLDSTYHLRLSGNKSQRFLLSSSLRSEGVVVSFTATLLVLYLSCIPSDFWLLNMIYVCT